MMDNLGYGIGDVDRDDAVYDLADEPRFAHDHGYQPSPEPVNMHVTGTQLRRRLITPETIAAIQDEAPRQSLVQGLLSRVRKRS
jgi:hypothetical protein